VVAHTLATVIPARADLVAAAAATVQLAKETMVAHMAVTMPAAAVAAQVVWAGMPAVTMAATAVAVLLIVYLEHLHTTPAAVVVAVMTQVHRVAVPAVVVVHSWSTAHKVQQTLAAEPAAGAILAAAHGTTVAVVARVLLLFLIKVLHSLVREAQ
jgi:hypothetical protein